MQLAQLNIAQAKYDLDAPQIKDFVDNLDIVNTTAENTPGFVWRLKDDSGSATNIQAFDDPNMLVNMSIWRDVDSLKDFMFRTHHKGFMRRKGEWFHKLPQANYVMWWIEENHRPTIEEALQRLGHLREHGESAYAFSFKKVFNKLI